MVIRQGDDDVIMVVRQHSDLVLRSRLIALEQQILQGALQARHFLRQALATLVLRRALGPGHVIKQVDGAERRGKAQQDERDRNLERRRDAEAHCARLASGPGASTSSIFSPARSSFVSSINSMSRPPVTTKRGGVPASISRFSSRDG